MPSTDSTPVIEHVENLVPPQVYKRLHIVICFCVLFDHYIENFGQQLQTRTVHQTLIVKVQNIFKILKTLKF